MDKSKRGPEVSEEETRESLIALSYTFPEKETAPPHPDEKVITENMLANGEAEGDDYRSKLISISNQSPDQPQPQPGQGTP